MQTIHLDDQTYVILKREEYERLATLAKSGELPALPDPDEEGNYPAAEYARVSLARKVLRQRAEAGLEQRELAELAGVRVETLCRIEKGKHTPSVPTIEKIDRALKRAKGEDATGTDSGNQGKRKKQKSGNGR